LVTFYLTTKINSLRDIWDKIVLPFNKTPASLTVAGFPLRFDNQRELQI